jgi:hypothetical protein
MDAESATAVWEAANLKLKQQQTILSYMAAILEGFLLSLKNTSGNQKKVHLR